MTRFIEIFKEGEVVGVILGTLDTTNIQESPCGFGDTLKEALIDLAENLDK